MFPWLRNRLKASWNHHQRSALLFFFFSHRVDTARVEALQATGLFGEAGRSDDEAEHSLEMMYPMLRRVLGHGFSVVPVLVGPFRSESKR
jgi:AmmeMemoRadiSam system protein B